MKSIKTQYRQNTHRAVAEKTFPELVKSKKDEDIVSFNQQLVKVLPELKKYINGRLNTAIKKGHFSIGKYKADSFINQLFIELYDHIDEIENEKDFYPWMFNKTNELLEDIIIEEEFDDFFFKNIDKYSKPEWDAMEEKFTVDGGGDFVMIEELDDVAYNENDYTLNHVFIDDNKNDLIEKIDKKLDKQEIDSHLQLVLHNLPLSMRTVFELFTNQHLELEEIAQITNSTAAEAERLLRDVSRALQDSLFNRYLVG